MTTAERQLLLAVIDVCDCIIGLSRNTRRAHAPVSMTEDGRVNRQAPRRVDKWKPSARRSRTTRNRGVGEMRREGNAEDERVELDEEAAGGAARA